MFEKENGIVEGAQFPTLWEIRQLPNGSQGYKAPQICARSQSSER